MFYFHAVLYCLYNLLPALKTDSRFVAVSDSPYPKEAFSIGEERDGENAVEGPVKVKDMDECLIYEDICHHICVNTQGSYRCECFPGYVLQDDASTCAEGNEEDHQPCLVTKRADTFCDVMATGKGLSVPFALWNLIYRPQSSQDPICCNLSACSQCIFFSW